MDGVEVIDLCSERKTEIGEQCEGKESPKQESRQKLMQLSERKVEIGLERVKA